MAKPVQIDTTEFRAANAGRSPVGTYGTFVFEIGEAVYRYSGPWQTARRNAGDVAAFAGIRTAYLIG